MVEAQLLVTAERLLSVLSPGILIFSYLNSYLNGLTHVIVCFHFTKIEKATLVMVSSAAGASLVAAVPDPN